MRMLDLFCGRFGWGRAFAARGWEVVGVDLVEPPEIPQGCEFVSADILRLQWRDAAGFILGEERNLQKLGWFDFACASSPCEKFSVFGMKNFHPNPAYPELGIALFNHTRGILEASGVPYVMENVRAAQQFVGTAVHHCGPFYLWGNAVPPLMAQGISKGINVGSSKVTNHIGLSQEEKRLYRKQFEWNKGWSRSKHKNGMTAKAATIPPELANCVADYAERLIEQRKAVA